MPGLRGDKGTMKKKCPGCGSEFVTSFGHQKYCTPKCGLRFLQMRWKQNHPERVRAHQRNYAEKHREKHAKKCQMWRENNPDKAGAWRARYNQLHSSEIAARQRLWRKNNRHKIYEAGRQYYIKHRTKILEYSRHYYAERRSRKNFFQRLALASELSSVLTQNQETKPNERPIETNHNSVC